MSRMTTDDKMRDLHAKALKQFDRIISVMQPERLQSLKDRRFCDVAGAQWEGALGEQFANRPMFEVNKVHLSVLRIINEYRNNRISVDFVSRDGAEDDDLADVCDGLFRADEQDSVAEEAYDNGFDEGVKGGLGAWRLRSVYEDEYSESDLKQRIRIEPIFEADSCVYFDIDAKRQDKRDAQHCFVLVPMCRESYVEKYNDNPTSWPKSITQAEFDWATPDLVYVAEYYYAEDRSKVVKFFVGINGDIKKYDQDEYESSEELQEELLATGYTLQQDKRVKCKKVFKVLLSGGSIIERPVEIAGGQIPIVPFYGKRWVVDGVERCMGHVRLAKDPQRLKNMQLSRLGEISAYSTVSKPILTPEQIVGHQLMWQDDNIQQYPYLLINNITDANGQQMPSGPLAYTKPPEIPQALAALLQLTETDMAEILGNPQNADKMVSNISGKAVELIQTRLDLQTYIYVSNFAKAIQRTGSIWLAMAKEIYVEDGRKMKTVSASGGTGYVELSKPMLGESGEVKYANDLSTASMDVIVEVGPSYNTQREAVARSLTNMLGVTQDPETQQILQAMLLMNTDGEGLGDVREYYRRKLVSMGVNTPTDEDKKRMAESQANAPQDPNAILANAMADEATANATKARADTLKTVADANLKTAQTAKTEAETLETVANVRASERESAMQLMQSLMSQHGIRPAELGEEGTDE